MLASPPVITGLKTFNDRIQISGVDQGMTDGLPVGKQEELMGEGVESVGLLTKGYHTHTHTASHTHSGFPVSINWRGRLLDVCCVSCIKDEGRPLGEDF